MADRCAAVYVYNYDFDAGVLGAAHATELPLLFESRRDVVNLRQEERTVALAVVRGPRLVLHVVHLYVGISTDGRIYHFYWGAPLGGEIWCGTHGRRDPSGVLVGGMQRPWNCV